MYTITSASHHFAICCSIIVLPVPKPPGTAAVLPLRDRVEQVEDALARRERRTRLDARSVGPGLAHGPALHERDLAGRRSARSVRRRRSRRRARPRSSGPPAPGGTSTRCAMAGVSGTEPSSSPGATTWPACALGANAHVRSRGSDSAPAPPVRNAGAEASERSMPSNTPPSSPGPSSAESGSPLPTTGSPGVRPPVYS